MLLGSYPLGIASGCLKPFQRGGENESLGFLERRFGGPLDVSRVGWEGPEVGGWGWGWGGWGGHVGL